MIRTIGEPIEVKRAPETGYQAQFSGPYAVAAGLLGGGGLGVGLDDFTDELAQDPQRRALMAKVDVVAGRRGATRSSRTSSRPCSRVRTDDGRELVEEVLTNRGGPQPPAARRRARRQVPRQRRAAALDADAADDVERPCRGSTELDDVSDRARRSPDLLRTRC